MYLCGPRKHNCQPFCGPEGRFYCSDSVCSLRPVPFSYLCVRVRILGVLKIVCGCSNKTWLPLTVRLLWSPFLLTPLPVSCPSTLHHSTTKIIIIISFLPSFLIFDCCEIDSPLLADCRRWVVHCLCQYQGIVWQHQPCEAGEATNTKYYSSTATAFAEVKFLRKG